MRTLVPQHTRKENAHAATMEVGYHSAHAFDAPWQIPEQVVLVATVDSDIRIGVPNEHAIDATVAQLQIVQIAIDSVLERCGIKEEEVVNHHLRLDKARLRPLEFRTVIFGAKIASADPAFHAPVTNIGE